MAALAYLRNFSAKWALFRLDIFKRSFSQPNNFFSVIECKWGHFDTCPTTKLISLDYQMLLTNFSSRWKSPVLFVDRVVDRNP